ncbi:MAG TPA: adenylate/guanylate cyclase domain-containing protein [Azospirillaceae bacterium]|nr:adenylate/guanylate cyclase domain-containing protein [Azospirillaceae bacterium]
MTDPKPASSLRRRRRIHLPIAAVLAIGFGGIVLLAVAAVLALGIDISARNTRNLLADKAALGIDGMVVRVRMQLDPARSQVEFLGGLMRRGELDPADPQRLRDHLRASLAAAPQITAISFLALDGTWTGAARTDDGATVGPVQDPYGRTILEQSIQTGGAHWVDPYWSPALKTSVLSVRLPVRRDGRFLGVLMVGVGFSDLSRFLAGMRSTEMQGAFILYDDTHVLAHPSLVERPLDMSSRRTDGIPLPTLAELGDPVASALWSEVAPGAPVIDAEAVRREPRLKGSDVREADAAGARYTYLIHNLPDYGTRPWRLVMAFHHAEVTREMQRVERILVLGPLILLAAVLLSLALGRAISRQVRRLARAAVALRELDFRAVPELPDSRFREVSDAAAAFNTMVAGLRWFETYVPKPLVLRLVRRGSALMESEEREVTVMFADIKGFSTMAEAMSPAGTAALLNRHFTLIAACIEAEGGTVDKFIGDAVMAFWGAPDHQPDHAARALRAARAIAARVEEAAARADLRCEPPVRVRVGLHSGPVVVGNIGAENRLNYTIVGDTVNAAARLEALGDDMMKDAPCVILASSDTVAAAPEAAGPVVAMGPFSLRGRTGAVGVCRLLPAGAAVPGGIGVPISAG